MGSRMHADHCEKSPHNGYLKMDGPAAVAGPDRGEMTWTCSVMAGLRKHRISGYLYILEEFGEGLWLLQNRLGNEVSDNVHATLPINKISSIFTRTFADFNIVEKRLLIRLIVI